MIIKSYGSKHNGKYVKGDECCFQLVQPNHEFVYGENGAMDAGGNPAVSSQNMMLVGPNGEGYIIEGLTGMPIYLIPGTTIAFFEEGNKENTEDDSESKEVNVPKNVERQAKKLSPEAKKGYDKAIDALKSGDTRGLNDYPLSGNRSGQRAIDIKGTGKGRGAGRIIYEYGENGEINIIEILTDHNH